MLPSDFEKSRRSQIKALLAMDKKQDMKVVELIELLLEQNPSSPVALQMGTQRYSIESVGVDSESAVRVQIEQKLSFAEDPDEPNT